jgi:hypothetical protein
MRGRRGTRAAGTVTAAATVVGFFSSDNIEREEKEEEVRVIP